MMIGFLARISTTNLRACNCCSGDRQSCGLASRCGRGSRSSLSTPISMARDRQLVLLRPASRSHADETAHRPCPIVRSRIDPQQWSRLSFAANKSLGHSFAVSRVNAIPRRAIPRLERPDLLKQLIERHGIAIRRALTPALAAMSQYQAAKPEKKIGCIAWRTLLVQLRDAMLGRDHSCTSASEMLRQQLGNRRVSRNSVTRPHAADCGSL